MEQRIKKIVTWGLRSVMVWAIGLTLFIAIILIISPQDPDKTTDAIVVLTGGGERIETGLQLFAAGKATHLFISGVHPGVTMTDIEKKWHSDVALPPCCMTLGYDARSTQQNAQETKAWIEENHYSSLRLVTADFHMNRSLIEFKHALPDVEIIPHPVKQPDATPDKLWFWAISTIEYHKTLIRWGSLIFSPQAIATGHNHE